MHVGVLDRHPRDHLARFHPGQPQGYLLLVDEPRRRALLGAPQSTAAVVAAAELQDVLPSEAGGGTLAACLGPGAGLQTGRNLRGIAVDRFDKLPVTPSESGSHQLA